MRLPFRSVLGLVALAAASAALGGCGPKGTVGNCCQADGVTYQWAPNPKMPDFSGIDVAELGTVRVRLIASNPEAVDYWHQYGTASAKEVVAYLGLVEVGRVQFDPGDNGVLEIQLPPGKYWLRVAGNSLTTKPDADGVVRTKRFPDRETTLAVEVGRRVTTTVSLDYSCMGYPFYAAI
jgi:hypothetical protein